MSDYKVNPEFTRWISNRRVHMKETVEKELESSEGHHEKTIALAMLDCVLSTLDKVEQAYYERHGD